MRNQLKMKESQSSKVAKTSKKTNEEKQKSYVDSLKSEGNKVKESLEASSYFEVMSLENLFHSGKLKELGFITPFMARSMLNEAKVLDYLWKEAAEDKYWIEAMEEELDQIEKNETWELVPRPKDKNVIKNKWVFKNKLNEDGQVVRNKARLVCKGYTQIECIDFEETFAPVVEWKP